MTVARADLPALRLRRGPDAAAVVRSLARIALTIGVLVAGFVVYEFGATSLLASRAQSGLREDLAVRVSQAEPQLVPYVQSDGPQNPVVVPADLPAFDPTWIPGLDPASLESGSGLRGEEFGAGFIVSEPLPVDGEALGRIIIPTAGVDWTVVEGVERDDLKTGAGHMPDTALPGQPGNAVISGHRTTYGAPFLHLDRVGVGDAISVETASGVHIYQVVESFVVEPGDTWVTSQWDGAWLTLTTCEPVLSARQRLVVVATLVAGPNAGVIRGGS